MRDDEGVHGRARARGSWKGSRRVTEGEKRAAEEEHGRDVSQGHGDVFYDVYDFLDA